MGCDTARTRRGLGIPAQQTIDPRRYCCQVAAVRFRKSWRRHPSTAQLVQYPRPHLRVEGMLRQIQICCSKLLVMTCEAVLRQKWLDLSRIRTVGRTLRGARLPHKNGKKNECAAVATWHTTELSIL